VRALLVYESIFGNTRDVALAVAEGLKTRLPVEMVEVGTAPSVLQPDVALLVVGGPTHAHGMTTAKSRADSVDRAGDRMVSRGNGLREWLETLQPTPSPLPAAVFDTRIKGPGLLWGSAAKPAGKRLRELGFRLVEEPQDFLVGGPTGPVFDRLVEGELDRARAWGMRLAASVAAPAPVVSA
jgi:hypothetical protein